MWLEVGCTNNHPGVVASYYFITGNCVQNVRGTTSVIRGDMQGSIFVFSPGRQPGKYAR